MNDPVPVTDPLRDDLTGLLGELQFHRARFRIRRSPGYPRDQLADLATALRAPGWVNADRPARDFSARLSLWPSSGTTRNSPVTHTSGGR